MSLSDISIRKPVFAWMLMAGMIIFGYLGFRQMGVSQLPDVDFPVVNIQVTYEGAAPEVMELDVVDPIESAVIAVEGVKSVTSSARLGSANISVEFGLEKDIDVAVSEVEAKINQAARNLPDDIDPPIITKVNPDDRPIMWLSITSENWQAKDLMSYVRDNVKDKIQTVGGVADVFLGGYVDPNLRVWVSQDKLNQRQLTVTDVIDAIQSEHNEAPSGYVEDSVKEKNVRTMGEASQVEEFKRLPMIRRGGATNWMPTTLGDVATVEEGLADVRRISRVNGIVGVGLGVRKQRGSNTVAVAKGVKAKMEQIAKQLPEGLKIGVNFDSTKFIEDSVHELTMTMTLAGVFTAIVCWFFLGSFSATINVILAIPTSILGAFIILKWAGFTLNTFTLLGLSLAIGIVVDDAIMVLENIHRHYEHGKSRIRASLEGANEIAFAALAATVAIMAIFIPVALMDGIIGKFFFEFGVTISVAVGLSYIEALTLTPMRCASFMDPPGRSSKFGAMVDRFFDAQVSFYERALKWSLNHRVKTLFVAALFFATSFYLVTVLPKEFVPVQDTSMFMIRVKAPDGSSLAFTDNKVKEVEAYLKSRPEVRRFFVAIGGFGGSESNTANMFVSLHLPDERPVDKDKGRRLTQMELLDIVRRDFKDFKGARVFVQDTSQGGLSASGRGFPVEFTLVGPDWGVLAKEAQRTMDAMNASGVFTDVDTDYKAAVEEVHIVPLRDKAKNYGVSVIEIGRTINALVGGIVVGKWSTGGHRNDIRVKMSDVRQENIDSLEKVYVRNTRGELVRLLDVVKIENRPGATSIARKDRSRAITIYSGVATGKSQDEALATARKLASEGLPEGYALVESGTAETYRESFRELIFALVLGIIVAYMVLGSQFNSFIDPVVVLVALPFSFTGAFMALWLTGLSLNIYSMIGLILLMGIVKKNSILMVDFTKQRRDEGLKINDALADACPKRLRPIMMTTFSTVAGAVPAAFSLGAGAETLRPMAVAVIGGALVSTVLTLLVVPPMYSLLAREKTKSEEDEELLRAPNQVGI